METGLWLFKESLSAVSGADDTAGKGPRQEVPGQVWAQRKRGPCP